MGLIIRFCVAISLISASAGQGRSQEDWVVRQQTMGRICAVQTRMENPGFGAILTEHSTRREACVSARNLYDGTLSDPGKCWGYIPLAHRRCTEEGIDLPGP
jgi:hypothetical protein